MFLRLDNFHTCVGSAVDRAHCEDSWHGASAILSPRTVVGGGQGGSKPISGLTLPPILYSLPSGALALAWKGVLGGSYSSWAPLAGLSCLFAL